MHGHVDNIELHIHLNGWTVDKNPDVVQSVYIDKEESIQDLKDMLKSLEELEGEKCL